MKLFAKRTRTVVVDPEEAEKIRQKQDAAEAAAAKKEAERALQELLKLDPTDLNAKQRRMVKRYQQRSDGDEPAASSPHSKVTEGEPQEGVSSAGLPETSEAEPAATADQESRDNQNSEAAVVEGSGLDEELVRNTLAKLNSKQRRTLTRKLDREGSSVLSEVFEEATLLLQQDQASEAKKVEDQIDASASQSPGKKRKRKADWSDLPPEERVRREEQRRMQQEAAERREKEGSLPSGVKKRHPLNSERRRANRRKPKWQRKEKTGFEGNEHHTSGFHMRRQQKQSH